MALVNWRTDDQGRSIKHLLRDQTMATLFAEAGAFALMARPPKQPIRPKKVPRWVR